MMYVFLLSVLMVLFAVAGMAVGLLLGRAPLCRGCAGLRALDDGGAACTACERRRFPRDGGDTEGARWRS